MSDLDKRPQVPNTMPFNEEDKELARGVQADVLNAKRTKKRKRIIASVATAAVFVGGGALAAKAFGGGEPAEKNETYTLLLDSNGEPAQYVVYPYDREDNPVSAAPNIAISKDRGGKYNTGNGFDDTADVRNGQNLTDFAWDQINKEWVDLYLIQENESLQNASELELSQITTIQTNVPDLGIDKPYWKTDFLELDPIVQDFVTRVTSNPEGIDQEELENAVWMVFAFTAEDVEYYQNK